MSSFLVYRDDVAQYFNRITFFVKSQLVQTIHLKGSRWLFRSGVRSIFKTDSHPRCPHWVNRVDSAMHPNESGSPPTADMWRLLRQVRFVPIAANRTSAAQPLS